MAAVLVFLGRTAGVIVLVLVTPPPILMIGRRPADPDDRPTARRPDRAPSVLIDDRRTLHDGRAPDPGRTTPALTCSLPPDCPYHRSMP
jgi:hypothetical protein